MLYHNPPLYIYTVDHYCGFLNVALIMMVDYRLYHTLHMYKYTFWDVMKKKKILKMISIWFRHFHSLNKVIKSGFEKEMRSAVYSVCYFFFFSMERNALRLINEISHDTKGSRDKDKRIVPITFG